MNWYYTVGPSHTRVRVFMNGALCGELCFRNEEFQAIQLESKARDDARQRSGVYGYSKFINFNDETNR